MLGTGFGTHTERFVIFEIFPERLTPEPLGGISFRVLTLQHAPWRCCGNEISYPVMRCQAISSTLNAVI